MIKWFLAIITMCCVSMMSFASTLDEIIQLEQFKTQKRTQNSLDSQQRKVQSKRYISLSNGKKIDISEWQIVHFMSSNCSYCRQFNPTLKQISEDTKIPIFVYSFDGKGDEFFPTVFPTNKEVINEFFAELPQATPTNFLVNVNTLVTLPISQGVTPYQDFLHRLDEVLIYADKHLGGLK